MNSSNANAQPIPPSSNNLIFSSFNPKTFRSFSLLRAITVIFLAVGYYAAGRVGLSFAAIHPSVSAIWPATGFALAAVYLLGYDMWPGIFLGAFFVNLTVGSVGSSFMIAVGNTAEALLGIYLLERFTGEKEFFDHTVGIVQFIFFAAMIGPAIAATVGAATLGISHFTSWTETGKLWFTWWMGDVTGALLIAPLLIMWGSIRGIKWEMGKILNFLGVFALVAFAEKLSFSGLPSFFPSGLAIDFITLPPLIVGAFWLGRRWEMTTVFFLAILATRDTVMGFGPFAAYPPNESLILLQTFLGVAAVATLIVSTLISERQTVMDSLAGREQYFRALIEKSSDGIVLVDANAIIQYASPSLKRITGYDRSDGLMGTSGLKIVHPDDVAILKNCLADVLDFPEKINEFEVRVKYRDGSWIILHVTATNLLDYAPVGAIVLNVRDVTREKQAQREKSYLAAIVESADDAIFGRDLEGIIHSWNKGAERLYGYTAEEAIGHSINMIMPSDRRRDEFAEITKRIKRGESVEHFQTVRIRKDGTSIPVSFSVSPMKDVHGTVIGASVIAHDLIKEKEIERRKQEFISSVSYQLRGPVGEIGTYIETLAKRKNKFTGIEQQYLLKIENANLRMAMLLNNLLKVTRVDLGTIPVEPRTIDLKREIDYVAREFAPRFSEKTIQFEHPYRRLHRAIVTIDPALLTAALSNLLTHALEYVPVNGKVSVELLKHETNFQIYIVETGSNIPVGVVDSRNTQAELGITSELSSDSHPVSASENPAMDLYVAKSLIERIGGSLHSEQTPTGTKFSIVFPIK